MTKRRKAEHPGGSLFSEADQQTSKAYAGAVSISTGHNGSPLSKGQKTFNALIEQIEKSARGSLRGKQPFRATSVNTLANWSL